MLIPNLCLDSGQNKVDVLLIIFDNTLRKKFGLGGVVLSLIGQKFRFWKLYTEPRSYKALPAR